MNVGDLVQHARRCEYLFWEGKFGIVADLRRFQPDDPVRLAAARADENDGNVAGGAKAAEEFDPVGTGKHDVEHDKRGLSVIELHLHFRPGRRGPHVIAMFFQRARDQNAKLRIVFDDEDSLACHQ